MKIPYWDATVTLFSKATAEDGRVSWSASVINGCFWHRKALRERTGGTEFSLNGFVCRIPGNSVNVKIGDIIVSGNIADMIDEYAEGMRSTDLIKRYSGNCMTVSEAHYNAGPVPAMNHLYAEGS